MDNTKTITLRNRYWITLTGPYGAETRSANTNLTDSSDLVRTALVTILASILAFERNGFDVTEPRFVIVIQELVDNLRVDGGR